MRLWAWSRSGRSCAATKRLGRDKGADLVRDLKIKIFDRYRPFRLMSDWAEAEWACIPLVVTGLAELCSCRMM